MSEQDGFDFDGVPYEDEPQEPDICRNRHGGEYFSEEANKDVSLRKSKQRDKMAAHMLNDVGDSACEEAEIALGMTRSSASARWSELKRAGIIVLIFDGDKRRSRPTRSGSSAGVYRHVRRGDTLAANEKADSPLDQPDRLRTVT